MKRFQTYLTFVLLVVLSACGGGTDKQQEAIGGKMYGGEFRFMSVEKVNNLFPLSTIDVYAQRINSQLFESLLKIDMETMNVVPALAESYKVSPDAKTFTFIIRKGVYFHDDACFNGASREVNARDVKFMLEFACSGLPENQMSYLLVNRIVGAADFNAKTKKSLVKTGVSGIRAVDDHTLEIKLTEPFSGFDKILSHSNLSVFPKEAYDKYGKELALHPVGTGPFMLEKMDDQGISLKRNPNYWKKDELGNQLPFMDKVTMTYVKDKKSELLAFRNKQIDLVLEIPVEEIENVFGSLEEAQEGKNVKHKVESETSMNINYIALSNECPEFSDVRVRKAFNLAINTKEIVDKYLLGEGWAIVNGFVPRMDNYPFEQVKGHKTNIDQAKELLASAGYPNGKNFPVMDFYVNALEGSSAYKMSMAVVEQIKRGLNIDLKIKLCTLEERDQAIASGKAKIWRSGWVADYPDAENFLSLFYSGNINEGGVGINAFKFRNQQYDALYEQALKETNPDKRIALLVRCDQLTVDYAPVIPILTKDFLVIVNARVRDLKTNSMESLDFSTIYIKEPKN